MLLGRRGIVWGATELCESPRTRGDVPGETTHHWPNTTRHHRSAMRSDPLERPGALGLSYSDQSCLRSAYGEQPRTVPSAQRAPGGNRTHIICLEGRGRRLWTTSASVCRDSNPGLRHGKAVSYQLDYKRVEYLGIEPRSESAPRAAFTLVDTVIPLTYYVPLQGFEP